MRPPTGDGRVMHGPGIISNLINRSYKMISAPWIMLLTAPNTEAVAPLALLIEIIVILCA